MGDTYSVGAFLSDDEMVLSDVRGEKYPAGHAYTIAAPSADLEVALRALIALEEKTAELDVNDGASDKETEAQASQRLEKFTATVRKLRAEHATLLAKICVDDAGETVTFEQRILGAAYTQMVRDKVRPRHLAQLATIVSTNFGKSEDHARFVLARAEGEAVARNANRADRRAAAKSSNSKPKGGTRSPRTSGAVSTRRSPASTRGSATSPPKRAAAKTA